MKLKEYLIVLSVAILLVATGQLGSGHAAWAGTLVLQTVPTRTPTPIPGGGDGDQGVPDSEGDNAAQESGI